MMEKANATFFDLAGSSYEIGYQLGKKMIENPQLLQMQKSDAEIFSDAQIVQMNELFDNYCPGLSDELRGFAEAVGVSDKQLYYYAGTCLTPGCSLLAALPGLTKDGNVLVARNYEFSHKMDDFAFGKTKVAGRYAHIGSRSMLFGRSEGINECGLMVGQSSCGLPVGNFEPMRRPAVSGLQFWAVIRSLLENCKDVEEALESVLDMPIAYNINLMLADKTGKVVLFETFDGEKEESIGNYLQKRRLSGAAQKLLYSDRRIIDIAMDSGFDSSEAFSRAFKSVYQVSPSTYRSNRLDVFLGNKKAIDRDFLNHISSRITVFPKIKKIDEIYVAGIRGTAALDNVFTLWQQFSDMQSSILNRHPSGRTFGICEYVEDADTANYNMELSEVIGMEVVTYGNLPSGTVAKTIPAGKFAVFTHKGSLLDILKTYQYIWGTWALLTDETIDERDDFELYDERFTGRENEDSEIDIYIPIK